MYINTRSRDKHNFLNVHKYEICMYIDMRFPLDEHL